MRTQPAPVRAKTGKLGLVTKHFRQQLAHGDDHVVIKQVEKICISHGACVERPARSGGHGLYFMK